MNIDEAKELLSHHSVRNPNYNHPKSQKGFLGSLRPFKGKLYEENFREIMECLKELKEEFFCQQIDKNIISDIVGIVHLTKAWTSEDGMLGSNNLLTDEQVKQLILWVEIIEECLMYLLEEDEESAFFSYNEYLSDPQLYLSER